MLLHLASIAAIDVRRENHQTGATSVACGASLTHSIIGRHRSDRRDDRDFVADRAHTRFPESDLLIDRKRSALAETSICHDASASVLHKPLHVSSGERVVDLQILIKASCDSGHDARPIHRHRFSIFTGSIGGLIERSFQPNRNSTADPQTRP